MRNRTRAAYRGAQFLRAATSALRSPIAAARSSSGASARLEEAWPIKQD
jgi:hypothetical protein